MEGPNTSLQNQVCIQLRQQNVEVSENSAVKDLVGYQFMADCEAGKQSALIWEFGHVLVQGNLNFL